MYSKEYLSLIMNKLYIDNNFKKQKNFEAGTKICTIFCTMILCTIAHTLKNSKQHVRHSYILSIIYDSTNTR